MNDRPKDPMTTFRSVIRGKNSKGGDRFQLYLTPEMATQIAQLVTEQNTSEKGVKLDLHISRKTYEGREFDSAIAFVKTVQEGIGGRAPGAGGGKFVPKTSPTTGAAASAAASLKSAQVKG